jgi:hypothetical protein
MSWETRVCNAIFVLRPAQAGGIRLGVSSRTVLPIWLARASEIGQRATVATNSLKPMIDSILLGDHSMN